VPQGRIELVFKPVSGAAGAISVRASPLNDESFYNPVKGEPIIKITVSCGFLTAFGQVDKIPDSLRSLRSIKFSFKPAHAGFKYSYGTGNIFAVITFGYRHLFSPCLIFFPGINFRKYIIIKVLR
jgi:hypothetical protein